MNPRRLTLATVCLCLLCAPPTVAEPPADASTPRPFIGVWMGKRVAIHTHSDSVNYDVDWDNDGSFDDVGVTGPIAHEYASEGPHTVVIRGDLQHFTCHPNAHGTGPDGRVAVVAGTRGGAERLVEVVQWGDIEWETMQFMFAGCSSLERVDPRSPDLRDAYSLSGMFAGATRFNGDLSAWDVSKIGDMSRMFEGATAFDQPLGSWDTSHAMYMNFMFRKATSFNQPLDTWDTSSVTDMGSMFNGAEVFDQPLGAWDTSEVKDMSGVFAGAIAFDQPLSTWNTSRVRTMYGMFRWASSFNQPLGMWDTSRVHIFGGMFQGATSFDQPLGKWDVSGSNDISYMFATATAFNQPLNVWDVKGIQFTEGVFYKATSFDPKHIDGWDVSADERAKLFTE